MNEGYKSPGLVLLEQIQEEGIEISKADRKIIYYIDTMLSGFYSQLSQEFDRKLREAISEIIRRNGVTQMPTPITKDRTTG